MKKLMPLMVLAIIVLFGCAKEETTTAALSTDNQQVEESSVWVINTNSESLVWELVTQDELPNNSATSATNRSNSSHTHGDFAWGPFTFSWSGTENNGGPHGSAYVEQTFGAPFNTTVQLTMETECVRVEGNGAVYGGTFTEVLNNPFGENGPFSVGNHMYFKVIDNGQGNNAPPDQHSTTIIIVPSFVPGCDIWPPNSGAWSNVIDVQEPGSVKVNN